MTKAEAGVAAAAWASRMALKILCKSFSEYLETLVVAIGASAIGGFIPKGPAGWSDYLSPDLEGGKESERVTKGMTEGEMEGGTEGRSWRRRPRPRTEIISELISSKNTIPNGLADPLGIEKLEL